MELVELDPIKDSLVGVPGMTGLSVEQRKRLTIAVELVANPSIVFMDVSYKGGRSIIQMGTHHHSRQRDCIACRCARLL